jgi:sugar lactone lactonase YvrE
VAAGDWHRGYPPEILEDPQARNVSPGQVVSFHVQAAGTHLRYGWQCRPQNAKSGWNSLSNDHTYSGTHTATLTVNTAQLSPTSVLSPTSAMAFRCVVGSTDFAGSSAVSEAKLTIDAHGVSTLAGEPMVMGFADSFGGGCAEFDNPVALAADAAGNVYVADSFNHSIRMISAPSGAVFTFAGGGGPVNYGSTDDVGKAARFYIPNGIAVDSAGNVYVADTGNCTIRKITPAGVVSTLAGLAGNIGSTDGTGSQARFLDPRGLAADSGMVTTIAGKNPCEFPYCVNPGYSDGIGSSASFWQPVDVAVDGNGAVYVADMGNDAIRKVTPNPDGTYAVSTFAGAATTGGRIDGAGSAARFNCPYGVAVDSANNVYVADSGNNTVRKITTAGFVSTVIGVAGKAGSMDGSVAGSAGLTNRTLDVALLNAPYGVAVDASGNLYVADSGNNTIRKFPAQPGTSP